jgi:hypothetical protein
MAVSLWAQRKELIDNTYRNAKRAKTGGNSKVIDFYSGI